MRDGPAVSFVKGEGHDLSYFTVNEAARLLKLHPKTVRRKIRAGEIEALRVGRQYRTSAGGLGGQGGANRRAVSSGGQASQGAGVEHVYVSTVIDIDGVSRADSQRFSTAILAVLDSGGMSSYANCAYYEDLRKMKVFLNSSMELAPELLSMVRGMLESRE